MEMEVKQVTQDQTAGLWQSNTENSVIMTASPPSSNY